eukprot:190222-Hanusia_phi.AAC.6
MDDVITRINLRDEVPAKTVSFKQDFRKLMQVVKEKSKTAVSKIPLTNIIHEKKFLSLLSSLLAMLTPHYEKASHYGKEAYQAVRGNRAAVIESSELRLAPAGAQNEVSTG